MFITILVVFIILNVTSGKLSEPVTVADLEPNVTQKLKECFPNDKRNYSYFGPERYFLPSRLKDHIETIRSLEVRRDDIWIDSFPSSGTTWMQEIVWLLNNNLNYEKASKTSLLKRYAFVEVNSFREPETAGDDMVEDYRSMKNSSFPRYMKTHLPLSLLPPTLLTTAKVIYVARNPMDVAVSFYYHNKMFKSTKYEGDFKSFWQLFLAGYRPPGNYFSHIKEAWSKRNETNMLFLFYEDIKKDTDAALRKISRFLGKSYTDQQYSDLAQYVSFDRLKSNKSVKPDHLKNSTELNFESPGFIRKGIVGDWRNHFDDEMAMEAEMWIHNNIHNTDLVLPQN